jgi:hypothetical protein
MGTDLLEGSGLHLDSFDFCASAQAARVGAPGQFCAAKNLQTLGAITRFLAC